MRKCYEIEQLCPIRRTVNILDKQLKIYTYWNNGNLGQWEKEIEREIEKRRGRGEWGKGDKERKWEKKRESEREGVQRRKLAKKFFCYRKSDIVY